MTDEITEYELPRRESAHENRYWAEGLWTDRSFIDYVKAAVDSSPDRRIVGPNRTVTFAQLDAEARQVAGGLQTMGVDSGDVVSYQLPNWIDTIVLHVAIARVGAIANPIVHIYRRREVEYILGDASSKVIVLPEEYRGFNYIDMLSEFTASLPELKHVVVLGDETRSLPGVTTTSFDTLGDSPAAAYSAVEISADDLHALLYTSGTTGDPKGVLHTHNTLLSEARSAIELLAISEATTLFMPAPLTHIIGVCYGMEMPFLAEMGAVLMDQWDPEHAVSLIDEHRCNVTLGTTPFLQGISDASPEDWSCPLRVFVVGGSDIPPELVHTASGRLDCTVLRAYGSTEHPTITWSPLDAPIDKLARTDGLATQGTQLKLVDIDSGAEVSPGSRGEILAHGPELMVGYLGATLNEDVFDDEWFRTGDIGVLDEDGYLEITGRKKDIIVRGGENISVKEVEDRLYEHPAIEEIAVVAMPDPDLQEKVCAYVVSDLDMNLTLEAVADHLEAAGLSNRKFPERLEFVDQLPKTASGKIQKNELREDIASKLDMEPISRE